MIIVVEECSAEEVGDAVVLVVVLRRLMVVPMEVDPPFSAVAVVPWLDLEVLIVVDLSIEVLVIGVVEVSGCDVRTPPMYESWYYQAHRYDINLSIPTIPPVKAPATTTVKTVVINALWDTDLMQQQILSRKAPNMKLKVLDNVSMTGFLLSHLMQMYLFLVLILSTFSQCITGPMVITFELVESLYSATLVAISFLLDISF